MKKRVYGKKLGLGGGARKALLRGLAVSLIEHGSITTTKTKAKYLQGFIEPLVTIAKTDASINIQRVYARLGNNKKATKDLFGKIAIVFKKRLGGYTRIVPLTARRGDSAQMAKIEWAENKVKIEKSKVKNSKNENLSTKSK